MGTINNGLKIETKMDENSNSNELLGSPFSTYEKGTCRSTWLQIRPKITETESINYQKYKGHQPLINQRRYSWCPFSRIQCIRFEYFLYIFLKVCWHGNHIKMILIFSKKMCFSHWVWRICKALNLHLREFQSKANTSAFIFIFPICMHM